MQEETEICLGLVPLTETLNGQYIHPKADSLPSHPIPVNDESTNSIPLPVFNGSRQNINQSQPNLSQSGYQQDSPPPYPGGNTSYPTDSKSRNSTENIGASTPPRVSITDLPFSILSDTNQLFTSVNKLLDSVDILNNCKYTVTQTTERGGSATASFSHTTQSVIFTGDNIHTNKI